MVVIEEATLAYRLLNGIFCVYKPAGISKYGLRNRVISNLSSDLCELKCRPPTTHVFIEGEPNKALTVTASPSYADMPEVIGPRYVPKDIRCHWATHMGSKSSGVFVFGIGADGIKSAIKFDEGRPLRVYHVSARLGQATDTCFMSPYSRVIEKASFKSVRRSGLDRILAAIQANHQQQAFHQIGVDPQSQAAYDLAVQGPIRPVSRKIPVLYGLKCINFDPPDYTVEVHCINENEDFLANLMLDTAIKHHTLAACTSIRCVRHGPFTFHDALLRKHWHLEHILNNMAKCKNILEQQVEVKPQLQPLVPVIERSAYEEETSEL
ncbi:mitochondrial mRNA pseudouridine synthase Trub2 [Ischnura elegans]|uniref:mitochondrial mRNA pseudouridine synthase Trub2 n=1 Tax=Ischnura elegans TaxID=197161 RepID=UPI001ED8AD45|nr:mitochondrial mRNA pseudouridine synthase Trub2 [Ischnura elegans]